ncbi:PTS beta-glucoside transporter subunit EIIBCA [Salipaludibacillus neizhouensis]|uniref:PTS beta-glucoside transporter subunit EIIBCA n=1 Tax=Salipaludibacillus neizhouensis TaxID=885475 RepID=A0A3A9KIV1_9BACI|nr:beta-glucoside-specific PTS transporter subunit IIABC [Salipaludibacillus neizhouensis]RKL64806.1 PTS beta-glucoside transporter subunit EIIBCA [Salipaludibacillus neizhouensis]
MSFKQTATDILKHVGGESNVIHLGHCSTRLRFTLVDDSKVNIEELKKVNGVIDIVNKAQFQVIIGNDVNEVYNELQKLGNFGNDKSNSKVTNKGKRKMGAIFLDFLVSVFQPLIPPMAGAGVLKSILLLLSVLNLIDENGQTYIILNNISGAVFYFLPIFVAITTAQKLKVNHLVAAAAMSILLFPNMTILLAEGASLFSIPLTNVNYASQVFPSILGVIFYAYMERFFTKVSPKPIRVFFVPMMALLLTVPMTLLFIGPIGFQLGTLLTNGILSIYGTTGWIAVGLLAAGLPFMIATGMHKALTPYAINSVTSLGKEMLFLPALLAHNMSQSAACFAVALRTKDTILKSTAVASGISALFGISEPALYGITLQRKRVLIGVVISCLIGGLSLGILGVAGSVIVSPSVASISMFVDPANSKNFIFALVGLLISLIVSFGITFISWKDDKQQTKDPINKKATSTVGTINIKQPIEGKVIPLSEVSDDVFSTKVMGEGIAVIPSTGELYAPVGGEIKMVFNTNHALGLEIANGIELLFHIGIDTVQLGGKYFESHVKIGDKVKAGDLLVKFDLNKIVEEGYDPTTITVVTNKDQFTVKVADSKAVNNNEALMLVTAVEN